MRGNTGGRCAPREGFRDKGMRRPEAAVAALQGCNGMPHGRVFATFESFFLNWVKRLIFLVAGASFAFLGPDLDCMATS